MVIPDFDAAQEMGQLTSPAWSALSMYYRVMHLNATLQWIKPLGSAEMLVSPAPEQAIPIDMKHFAATYQNIKAAY